MTTRKASVAIRITLLAWCAVVSARSAAAQETINYASVSGRVTDPTGAVVVDAQVTARHIETNVAATAITDGQGGIRMSEQFIDIERDAPDVEPVEITAQPRVETNVFDLAADTVTASL